MKFKYFAVITAFIFCSISVNGQSKVGTVNVNQILTQLPEIANVEKALKTYTDELDATLKEKVAVYKKKLDLFKENADTYSDVMKKTMGEELYNLETDINKFKQNGTTLTQLKQDELLRPLYKKISDMITIVAKEQHYTQILTVDGNEIAYADEKLDISKAVLSRLGVKTE